MLGTGITNVTFSDMSYMYKITSNSCVLWARERTSRDVIVPKTQIFKLLKVENNTNESIWQCNNFYFLKKYLT
jgi:hypothetical protein